MKELYVASLSCVEIPIKSYFKRGRNDQQGLEFACVFAACAKTILEISHPCSCCDLLAQSVEQR